MIFKIDTKEKFTVITPMVENLSDNLTAELARIASNYLQKDIKNAVLNLDHVQSIDEEAATHLTKLEQTFYENNASFVICGLQSSVEEQLEKFELLELMNVTPTEAEAGDMVQMEEIERELMEDDNPSLDDTDEEEKE
jgi:anti-anti-sigma regulatory factor